MLSKQLAKLNELKPFRILLPHEDDVRALEYYRDELEDTIKRFDSFKEKVNNIIKKGKTQDYLYEFRGMFSGYCLVKYSTVTIIQCTNIINRSECNFYEECKVRKNIIDSITIK